MIIIIYDEQLYQRFVDKVEIVEYSELYELDEERLYGTSEKQIHSIITILAYVDLMDVSDITDQLHLRVIMHQYLLPLEILLMVHIIISVSCKDHVIIQLLLDVQQVLHKMIMVFLFY